MDLLPLAVSSGIWGLTLGLMYLMFRSQLKTERAEKLFYRQNFFRTIGLAERQTDISEKLIEPVKKQSALQARLDTLIAEVESLRERLE